jgi:hypothetical protein
VTRRLTAAVACLGWAAVQLAGGVRRGDGGGAVRGARAAGGGARTHAWHLVVPAARPRALRGGHPRRALRGAAPKVQTSLAISSCHATVRLRRAPAGQRLMPEDIAKLWVKANAQLPPDGKGFPLPNERSTNAVDGDGCAGDRAAGAREVCSGGRKSEGKRGGSLVDEFLRVLHPLLDAHRGRATRGGPASPAARLRAAALPPLVRPPALPTRAQSTPLALGTHAAVSLEQLRRLVPKQLLVDSHQAAVD